MPGALQCLAPAGLSTDRCRPEDRREKETPISKREKFPDEETVAGYSRSTTRPQSAPMQARLVVLGGKDVGRRIALADELVIGRDPAADFVVDDGRVSRRHLRVFREDGRYYAEDLRSRNGSMVNGQLIEKTTLEFGDRIHIGSRTVLLFTFLDPQEEWALEAQKMEALGRLGAGVAHDLNNLLGAVSATLEFLSNLPTETRLDDADVVECMADIRSATDRAAGLAGRLTASVRRSESELIGVDMGELTREIAHLASRTFSRSIRVEITAERNLFVRGNASALHQLLLNLSINARDAMPHGGSLCFDASVADPALGDMVVVSVKDDGVGMSDATMSRIFEPLFTTKKAGTGTGLGLATVRQIARSHGGRIEVESALGKGSIFRVFLPLDRSAKRLRMHRTVPLQTTRIESIGSARILIVDDEDVVARSTARLLRRQGFEVEITPDGQSAVEQCRAGEPPDLVLLDLDMPGMSGEECQRVLRSMLPALRILFVSGHRDTDRERLVFEEGALGFVRKPYEMTALLAAIRSALHQPPVDVIREEP